MPARTNHGFGWNLGLPALDPRVSSSSSSQFQPGPGPKASGSLKSQREDHPGLVSSQGSAAHQAFAGFGAARSLRRSAVAEDARPDSSTLDPDQCHSPRRSALDRHRSLHAVKVARHQNDEFLVRLTLDGGSSDLSHPTAIGQLLQRGTACVWFDPHADNCPDHRFLRHPGFEARGNDEPPRRAGCPRNDDSGSLRATSGSAASSTALAGGGLLTRDPGTSEALFDIATNHPPYDLRGG